MKKIAIVLSTVLIGFSCQSPANTSPPSDDAQIQGEVGASLDKRIGELTARYGIPQTVVSVVHGDDIVLKSWYGGANSSSLFYCGSTTKSMTATMIASLVSKGVLNWDDPVQTFLPDFFWVSDEISMQVTIRDLLSMRFGMGAQALSLPYFLFDLDYSDSYKMLPYMTESYPFRKSHEYTNAGPNIAAHIAEIATGRNYNQLMQDEVFVPLGMTDAGTDRSHWVNRHNDKLAPHFYYNGSSHVMSDAEDIANTAPAGGAILTLNDMTKYLEFLLDNNGNFIDSAVLSETHRIQIETPDPLDGMLSGESFGYGMGWKIRENFHGKTLVYHEGDLPGYTSIIAFVPEEELGFVLASNSNPNYSIYAMMDEIFAKLLNVDEVGLADFLLPYQQQNQLPEIPESMDIPESLQSSLTGRWEHPLLGAMTIESTETGLMVQLDEQKILGTIRYIPIPADEGIEESMPVLFFVDSQYRGFSQPIIPPGHGIGQDELKLELMPSFIFSRN